MLRVNPYIAFKGNCRQAIEFYKNVLGAEVQFIQTVGESPMSNMGPAENIMHCTINVGDSTIMTCDDPRPEAAAADGNISLGNRTERSGTGQTAFRQPRQGRYRRHAAQQDLLGGSIRDGDRQIWRQVDGQLRGAKMPRRSEERSTLTIALVGRVSARSLRLLCPAAAARAALPL